MHPHSPRPHCQAGTQKSGFFPGASDEPAEEEILGNPCDKQRKEGGSQCCGESPATQDNQSGLHQRVAIELGLGGCVGVHQGRNGEEITTDRGTDGIKVHRDKSPH